MFHVKHPGPSGGDASDVGAKRHPCQFRTAFRAGRARFSERRTAYAQVARYSELLRPEFASGNIGMGAVLRPKTEQAIGSAPACALPRAGEVCAKRGMGTNVSRETSCGLGWCSWPPPAAPVAIRLRSAGGGRRLRHCDAVIDSLPLSLARRLALRATHDRRVARCTAPKASVAPKGKSPAPRTPSAPSCKLLVPGMSKNVIHLITFFQQMVIQ